MSALMQAVFHRRWRQAKILMEIGCNVNGRGENGRTPLIEMCLVDNEDKAAGLARVLLEKGANLDLKDNDGRTAFSNACLLHRTQLFTLFMKFGDFDFNSADCDGNTALFHAITAGDASVVKVLISKMTYYGLNVDVLNTKGETPLIYALKSKKRDIAEVLIRQGKASLEARDLEFQKSASEWRDDMTTKEKNIEISSAYFKTIEKAKPSNQPPRSVHKRLNKTTSAKVFQSRVILPRVSKTRPTTAPDRIIVPDYFRPCAPIQKSLNKLYLIYDQQTTDSYRHGYKRIKYKEPIREETLVEISESPSRSSCSKTAVSFNQVNDLSVKLQGLYKSSVTKRKALASHQGLPRIDSANSLTGRSSSQGKTGKV